MYFFNIFWIELGQIIRKQHIYRCLVTESNYVNVIPMLFALNKTNICYVHYYYMIIGI